MLNRITWTLASEAWKPSTLVVPAATARGGRQTGRGSAPTWRTACAPSTPLPNYNANPFFSFSPVLLTPPRHRSRIYGGEDPETWSGEAMPHEYVTAMVKGGSHGFGLKGGNAQSGLLTTLYDGPRPNRYQPMKKQGSIILGIGGDNSDSAVGTFCASHTVWFLK